MSRSSVRETRNRRRDVFCFLFFLMVWMGASAESVSGQDVSKEEHIGRFAVDMVLDVDAVLSVTETIEYDFGTAERHGIYRDIPVRYETVAGNRQNLALSVKSVTDASGRAYPYERSNEGDTLRIKIGDKDTFVTGQQTYVIRYDVRYVIGSFTDFDELYWNAIGNDWSVPIRNVSVHTTLPQSISHDSLKQSCYSGVRGSTERCDIFGQWDGDTYNVTLPHALDPGEGVTLAFGFPKGIVDEPTFAKRMLLFITDNPLTLLPLLVFGVMGTLWYRTGRDPKGRGVIIAEYASPENLSPLEVAGLLHNAVTAKSISAALIGLAVGGYLTIRRTDEKILFFSKEDYLFRRTSKDSADILEQTLLKALFGSADPGEREVKLSDLKEKFFKEIPAIEKETLTVLVNKEYFPRSPKSVLSRYILIGILAFFFAFVVLRPDSPAAVVALAVSCIIYFSFSLLMPKVTREGALLKERILGLKEYLEIAEKNRIAFHNAPEKRPALFESLLPFAMILGVEKAWAKEFEDIYTTPPSWYGDASMAHFSATGFVSGLDGFAASTSSALASAPGGSSGSSGGGFSGGGGGGGGGGSW